MIPTEARFFYEFADCVARYNLVIKGMVEAVKTPSIYDLFRLVRFGAPGFLLNGSGLPLFTTFVLNNYEVNDCIVLLAADFRAGFCFTEENIEGPASTLAFEREVAILRNLSKVLEKYGVRIYNKGHTLVESDQVVVIELPPDTVESTMINTWEFPQEITAELCTKYAHRLTDKSYANKKIADALERASAENPLFFR